MKRAIVIFLLVLTVYPTVAQDVIKSLMIGIDFNIGPQKVSESLGEQSKILGCAFSPTIEIGQAKEIVGRGTNTTAFFIGPNFYTFDYQHCFPEYEWDEWGSLVSWETGLSFRRYTQSHITLGMRLGGRFWGKKVYFNVDDDNWHENIKRFKTAPLVEGTIGWSFCRNRFTAYYRSGYCKGGFYLIGISANILDLISDEDHFTSNNKI